MGHVDRAHGVVVSHPLSMREALGSIPSVSIFSHVGSRNRYCVETERESERERERESDREKPSPQHGGTPPTRAVTHATIPSPRHLPTHLPAQSTTHPKRAITLADQQASQRLGRQARQRASHMAIDAADNEEPRRNKNEAREIRTPNLLIWSQTRCHCAIPPRRV